MAAANVYEPKFGSSRFQDMMFGNAAIASSDRYSAEAGKEVLDLGGNAVDAAVAIAFASAVTYPEAGNIAGGGLMNIFMDGASHFLDYREIAPLAARRDMFLGFVDAQGFQDPLSSMRGAQAAAVPGTVRGLAVAHQRFGRLGWKDLLAPAIKLARDGYFPEEQALFWLNFMRTSYGHVCYPTNLDEYFGSMKVGSVFKQPELAATLIRIADHGAGEFYSGRTADMLVAAMSQDGGVGLITKEDLAAYRPLWREPIVFEWNGMTVTTAPPPSSGGIALASLLGMKSHLRKRFANVGVNSPTYIHLNAEMMKRVFADRAEYLGDPDYVSIPLAELLDPDYIARRASQVSESITPSDRAQPGLHPKMHTTHFSVADKWGNAVSNTFTLNLPFGSGVVARGGGFLLNGEMDDFATIPGQPNHLGVIGGEANSIAAGKRPLTSMSPTIILKDGKLELAIGTPGGSRIPTAVYQVLSNLYDYEMPLVEAVAHRRFHHQLPQGNEIEGEPHSPIPPDLERELKEYGYGVCTAFFDTDIQAIQMVGDVVIAAADPRGRGLSITT